MLINSIATSFQKVNFTSSKLKSNNQTPIKTPQLPNDSFVSSINFKDKSVDELASLANEAHEIANDATVLSEKVQKEASEIYQKMEETLKKVTDLYNKIQQGDYQGTAKLTDGVLKEFDEAGNLTRKSIFANDSSCYIDEYKGKTTNKLSFYEGKPFYYQKGCEELVDGSRKADIKLRFYDGKPLIYTKGFEKLVGGSWKGDFNLLFSKNGKLSQYIKDFEELADGSWKADFNLLFDRDGKLWHYLKDFEELADGSFKSALDLMLIDGKWQEI